MQARKRGRGLIVAGFVAIFGLMLVYSRYQDPSFITPDAVDDFLRMAVGFYIALLAAFGGIAYGLYVYHKTKSAGGSDLLSVIARVTWNFRSRRIFLITFVGYGLFFSLASGTLVYQPDVTFSYHYGVDVPSAQIAPCCDAPGYMPKILVYLDEHIGLQIIPINLVLQVTVSYLVGLNTAIAMSTISVSRKSKSATSASAAAGLFIACPTCAGTLSSVFVGSASSIAISVALAQLQTLFIAISIPVLLAAPFILARRLKGSSDVCDVTKVS